MTSHLAQTPAAFAAGYLSAMRARWDAPVGRAIRDFTPRVFPGAPPEAFLGFTTEAGTVNPASVDTALPPPAGVNNPFHEIGYFQTEAGPASGPAPNPDPAAPDNAWGRLADDPTVVALLGRPATMVPGAWATATDDQAAVGLVSLRAHARGVATQLPAGIRPSGDGTQWAMVLAFMGFGAGDGGAARTINRYAARLASVDEPYRWGALIEAILDDADAHGGALPGRPGHHGNPAFDALRVWHKLATGQALARSTGGDAAWFDPGLGADEPAAQRALVAAAFGEGAGGAGAGGVVLGVGLAAGVAAVAWRLAFGAWPWSSQ